MRARKVDSNQAQIVKALRKCGFAVAVTSGVGEGFPDLVISKDNKSKLCEIKDPSKPPSQRKLTEDQVIFHNNWRDHIIIALDFTDIIKQF